MIVESTIIATDTQADGRRYVTESHIDGVGREYRVEYLADADADVAAAMAERAAVIEAESAAAEVELPIADMQMVAGLVSTLTAEQQASVLAVAEAIEQRIVPATAVINGQ